MSADRVSPSTEEFPLRESSRPIVDILMAELGGTVSLAQVVRCVSECDRKVRCTCTSLDAPVRAGIVESMARTRVAAVAARVDAAPSPPVTEVPSLQPAVVHA